MKKLLAFLLMGVMCFMPKNKSINFEKIVECFSLSSKIEITIDNKTTTFAEGQKEFNDILLNFETMIKDSLEMPAFGVSLHDLTINEKTKGVWIEFIFDKTFYSSDMPFDSLLINVEKDFAGFNIIRKYENKYDGRCFYLSLTNTTMDNLYDFILTNFD